jgi:hypothetical protein
MSGQMLFGVNSLLGQAIVTFIEFRVDPLTVRAERALRPPKTNHVEQEQRALHSADGVVLAAADAIHDEDLRHRFLLAAGSCLERSKQE